MYVVVVLVMPGTFVVIYIQVYICSKFVSYSRKFVCFCDCAYEINAILEYEYAHTYVTQSCLAKQIPRNLKGKSKSSQEWLTRQFADPYVEKAKMMNLRCRSAFKLIEIDDRFKILKPGDTVLDCGAAPGGWTQVAVDRTNANGIKESNKKGAVFSIDLLHFHAVPGATIFGGLDFTTSIAQQRLREAIAGRQVNCVLSDMAPNATGVRMLDQENIMSLCYSVLRFALAMSAINAHLVVKLWANGDVSKLETDLGRFYEQVKRVKPESSRSDSAELFLVARQYKGMEAANERTTEENT